MTNTAQIAENALVGGIEYGHGGNMDIFLKRISLKNFKGAKEVTITFGNRIVIVKGMNASGKTTINDAFLWLLFDKDSSGNGKFGIRPVDKDGKDIDNLEISVEVVLIADGKEITFRKVQKQKWTKHRGSSAPTFEGNVNSFEIDGFPQSKAEFQKRISEIIPEETFRLVADLGYFPGLDWKDKRKLLLNLCGDVTDDDVFSSDAEYWEPIKDDVETAGVDKAREKAKKALRDLNNRQKELSIRIDEASKQKQEVPDTDSIVEQIGAFEKKLEYVTEQIHTKEQDATVPLLKKQIAELEAEKAQKITDVKREIARQRNEAQERVLEYQKEVNNAEIIVSELIRQKSSLNTQIEDKKVELNYQGKIYHNNENPVPFDESKRNCPVCGQMLPQGRIEQIVEQYKISEEEREVRKNKALETGKELKAEITALEQKIAEKDSEIEDATDKADAMKAILESVKKDMDSIKADTSGVDEVDARIQEVRQKLAEAEAGNAELEDLRIDSKNLASQIKSLEAEIANAYAIESANDEIDRRIETLREIQVETGQLIAECEQKLILLEEFSMKKSELLSKKITSCFTLANFSLFSQQINGGLVEECEITYNGVRFRDLNSGHRIAVALDIIRSFQDKMGFHAPVYVDNAESINPENIPEMPCQLILLSVTEDPVLKVEGGTICTC